MPGAGFRQKCRLVVRHQILKPHRICHGPRLVPLPTEAPQGARQGLVLISVEPSRRATAVAHGVHLGCLNVPRSPAARQSWLRSDLASGVLAPPFTLPFAFPLPLPFALPLPFTLQLTLSLNFAGFGLEHFLPSCIPRPNPSDGEWRLPSPLAMY